MQLIVVESPTKAKTLGRFLGKGYAVEATMGHIKDLPKSKLGVNVEKNFTPDYILVEKKGDVVERIKKSAKGASKIFLASDPDREGEAIAQHVKEILTEKSKASGSKINRIVFHEITKEAVEEAIANPHAIDENLVDAQTARRVLDRLVGYKLSPLLWKKVRIGLSAGRVQSVAVRLIVEREREIAAFSPEEYWEIFCQLKAKEGEFSAKLVKVNDKKADIKNKTSAVKIVTDLEKSKYQIAAIEQKEVHKSPYAPFTTSTLAQTASRLFYWSSKKTMSVAQSLYEEGLITYHRTDSTNIAASAIASVRNYIKKEYGESYLPDSPRFYKTKAKVAQEAHEAVRPTNVNSKSNREASRRACQNSKWGHDAEKLYQLIWKRFVACQMSDAVYDETNVDVAATGASNYLLSATGQVIKFAGWKRLYEMGSNGEALVQLPKLQQGESLKLKKVDPQQKFTVPPARYTEATLIKTLEKLGIGRPSTYAPTISTIQIRNYVERDEGKFAPTPVGVAVNDYLIKYFPDTFEYSFTAHMEEDLDNVANGEMKWTESIKEFWGPFEKILATAEKKSKRVKIETQKLGRKCPGCKKGELVVRTGRFGKFVSCSRFPDCKYTEKLIIKVKGIKCPDCKSGDVVVKKTQKGRKFYGCSRYPDCKWASWKNPKEETSNKD